MADLLVDNPPVTKKKSKKKKRKAVSPNEPDTLDQLKEQTEKYPKQTVDQEEHVITTSKCTYCGKIIRQLVRGPKKESSHIVACESCLKLGVPLEDKGMVMDGYTTTQPSQVKENLCNCVACITKRENSVSPEVERDAHITQSYWMEIRHIVRCIYRDSMDLSDYSTRENIGSVKMHSIVKKLCSRDPHQFFQRLETLAREYLLEVKVRLLEQLSCGFNSPQLAIEFIQMLLDEYSTLCSSLPGLLFLLEPLESTEYVKRLGLTIELVNKNIFRELIFAESFMSSNLPLIIAQLRLASLSSDPFHRNTADSLSQRYIALDKEMEEIGKLWKSAKDQLHLQHQETKRVAESTRNRARDENDEHRKATSISKTELIKDNDEYMTDPVQVTTGQALQASQIKENQPQSNAQRNKSEVANHKAPHHRLSSLIPSKAHDHPAGSDNPSYGGWLTKEQVAEFSKILFKCIKPMGEPEFRITDNIATHTITLKIDMTSIDLKHAEAACTREQVEKYEQLGMRREEIAEVILKLNAIKHLGINLRIDDLFDEHGLMVVDGNEMREEREDAVYFVEDGRNSIKGKEKLIREEMARSELVDLSAEKEKVLARETNKSAEGRETDLLQSMTMKIRFMKTVLNEEVRSRLISDSEQVMFESCDQVQMKLTQLELNTVRLMRGNSSLASNLGMVSSKPQNGGGAEKYLETESHQPFVNLLREGKASKQAKNNQTDETKPLTSKEAAVTTKKSDRSGLKDTRQNESNQHHHHHSHHQSTGPTPQHKPGGHPVSSIPSKTQNCQCFACIGAIAAQETEGKLRPLNPISGDQLTIKDVLAEGLEKGTSKAMQSGDKEPITKITNKTEHVWQNWMSSTDEEIKANHEILTNTTAGCNSSNGNGHTSHTNTNHTHCSDNPSSSSTHGTTCNSEEQQNNGPVRRYCPCCYCELFGQNASGNIPTSHNYTKQRDKMRQKLEKKRNRKDGSDGHVRQCPHGYAYRHISHHSQCHNDHHITVEPPISPPSQPKIPSSPQSLKDQRSLDELVRFIEGDKGPAPPSSNNVKPKRKHKKKKVTEQPSPVENEVRSIGANVANSNGGSSPNTKKKRKQQDKGTVNDKKVSSSSDSTSPVTARKQMPTNKSSKLSSQVDQYQSNGISEEYPEIQPELMIMSSTTSLDTEIDEDYDRQLEDFKRLCFNTVPVDARKKIPVSLNMQDIISKMK